MDGVGRERKILVAPGAGEDLMRVNLELEAWR